jgi:hypothetical protein
MVIRRRTTLIGVYPAFLGFANNPFSFLDLFPPEQSIRPSSACVRVQPSGKPTHPQIIEMSFYGNKRNVQRCETARELYDNV